MPGSLSSLLTVRNPHQLSVESRWIFATMPWPALSSALTLLTHYTRTCLIKYGELRVAGPKLLAVSFGSAAHHHLRRPEGER